MMNQKSLEERKKEFELIMSQYPNEIPILMDKHPDYPDLETPTKSKFLVDKKITVENFKLVFRTKYLNNIPTIFLLNIKFYVKRSNIEISDDFIIEDFYNKFKEEDGFLYLKYSYEIKKDKDRLEKLLKEFPGKLPIILTKDKNYPNIKNVLKKNFLVPKAMTISQFIYYLCSDYFDENLTLFNENFEILNKESSEPISKNESIEDVFNKYKSEDGLLYLKYFYTPLKEKEEPKIVNKLPLYIHEHKKQMNLEERKEQFNKILSEYKDKIPIILEKYPLSKLEDKSKKYLIPDILTLNQIILIVKKLFKDDCEFSLITDKNITLDKKEMPINDIYEKYKDEDNLLYLFYIEPELLKNWKEAIKYIFKFKEKYNLEERKEKYQELQKEHPGKVLIIVENDDKVLNDKELNEILYLNPNDEIDSLKMKIWRQIDKPFMIINLLDKNKNIINNYYKIIDLYNDLKDNDDEFLYLYYKCSKPFIENTEDQDIEDMSEAYKIFLLFKRIPFIFNPSPSFNNSKKKMKVFIAYKSKSSTFKEIQTDKPYKYYLEYPNKEVNLNENVIDFYLKNKNNKDDFLHLIIESIT